MRVGPREKQLDAGVDTAENIADKTDGGDGRAEVSHSQPQGAQQKEAIKLPVIATNPAESSFRPLSPLSKHPQESTLARPVDSTKPQIKETQAPSSSILQARSKTAQLWRKKPSTRGSMIQSLSIAYKAQKSSQHASAVRAINFEIINSCNSHKRRHGNSYLQARDSTTTGADYSDLKS